MQITRRNAIKAAGMAAAAMTTGASAAIAEEAIVPAETKTADIVVVGGGMSGLAATVAAAGEGKKVVVLEQGTFLGGNGLGTEGVFGCGSSMQKEQGIDFTFSECITKENEFFNYRIDTLMWKDMFTNSASNIDWLMEQGVLIDHVDDYRGMGSFAGFHWWGGFVDTGVVSVDGALNGYITPMAAKAEELGVEILMETRGRQLIMADGVVAGVLAEQADGSWLQIDCKAVVLASGGYLDSDEKMAEVGVNTEGMVRKGTAGHRGDGFDMAMAAGGVDTRHKCPIMKEPGVVGHWFETPLSALGVRLGGPFMFVNQNGERFTNENCTAKSQAYMGNVCTTQEKVFVVASQACMEYFEANCSPMGGFLADAEEALTEEGTQAWRCDTVDELAACMGVDPELFVENLATYNGYCVAGKDDDFAKEPEFLIAIEEGPFWGFQMDNNYFTTLGGIKNNRKFEVVNAANEPIAGLYVCGADGCQLYRETYTVLLPASCMANNINSGRFAGLNAAAYVG